MFVQYLFKNYRSYQEECTINFIEARITEFSNTLYTNSLDNIGIIPLFMVYGPNGCGKTNIFQSLTYLSNTVKGALNIHPYYKEKPGCKKRPTEFDMTFRIDDVEYDYILKTMNGIVVEETLFKRVLPAANYDVVFDRDEDGVFLGEALQHISVELLEDNFTMLAFIHQTMSDSPIEDAISYLLAIEILDTNNLTDIYLKEVCNHILHKSLLLTHMKDAGIPLSDIRYLDGDYQLTYQSGMKLSLSEEAKGVTQLLHLLSYLILHMNQPTPILIDHIEYQLHPQVLAYIIGLFSTQRKDTTKAQLFSTTCDMSIMSNRYLRRDEIWLCDKTIDGSSLCSLADYRKEQKEKVRKDETYFKQYLEGRYGSLPTINS